MAARPPSGAKMSPPVVGPVKAPKVPRIIEEGLTHGVQALVVRHGGIPLVEFRVAFALPEGEISKPAALTVLCHSLFAGTQRRDRTGLAEALEGLGAHFGADVHDDYMVLSGSVLAANLAPFLSLVGEILTAPAYPEDEVRADAARAADEALIALSQPEVTARQALRRRMFKGHPYSTPIASPAALRRVNAGTLGELHGTLLGASVPVLALVGDVQPARATAWLEEALGAWLARRKTAVPDLRTTPPLQPGPIELVARTGSIQSNLRLGGPAPSPTAPDWPAALLAESIAGGMFTSRITVNLRERNGYTYTPHMFTSHFRAGSHLVAAADVASEVTAAALVETRYELGRIATTGVTPEELEIARRHAVGRFAFQIATQSGLANTLVALAVKGTGIGYLRSHPKGLLAATKDDVDDAARRYLAPSQLATVVVGDPQRVQGQLELVDEVVVRAS